MTRLTLVFWLLVLLLRKLIRIIAFFFIIKVFNIRNIFFFLLENDVNICWRKLLASSLFLSTMVSKTSLVNLVFFLLDRRWLLFTGYVSQRVSANLFFLKFLSSFFAGLYLWRHLVSIFWVSGGGYNNVFASISISFSTPLSQKSNCWL